MPLELLHLIAQGELPKTIHDPNDIDKLRVLAAACLVQARLPDVHSSPQTAQVMSLTAEGRAALAKEGFGRFSASRPVAASGWAGYNLSKIPL